MVKTDLAKAPSIGVYLPISKLVIKPGASTEVFSSRSCWRIYETATPKQMNLQ